MTDGPVYFSCYSNATLSCMDNEPIDRGLTLNDQTKGDAMDSRSKYLLIIYKIYHKTITTSPNPK